jgi:predicted dehydrogenase
MGRRHVRVVRDLGLQLVGVCDSSSETLALAEREQGILPDCQFGDVSSMLHSTHPDCVIVATTAPTHGEYTCMAAEAGAKYILCEKPMAVSLAECARMIQVCGQRNVKLAINHQMRFMEQYTEGKQIVKSEAFGGLSSVNVIAGNFGMAMNGTHYFEMFRYMSEEPPVEVTAWLLDDRIQNPRGPQFEDRAGAVRLVTAGGKRFYMEIGPDQGHGVTVVYGGRYGQLIVDELAGRMHLRVREEQYRGLPTTRYGMPWVEREYKIQPADSLTPSRAVLKALLNDQNPPTGEDGQLAVAVLVGAYVSDENAHVPIRLDSGKLPRDRVFPWA